MKRLCSSLLLFLLTSCGYYAHKDPPTYIYESDKVAELSARAQVNEKPGRILMRNVCCGSMRPTIQEGDWLVVEVVPFSDDLKGRIVVYRPAWNKGQPVMHRLVSGNAQDGFIASGDNNSTSEASERVRVDNFDSVLIAIYRHETIL